MQHEQFFDAASTPPHPHDEIPRRPVAAGKPGNSFERTRTQRTVVDLVTSDAGTPAVEWILLPGALTFAGIEQSSVAVIDLRDRRQINDETLRQVERELDLEELRMEG